ncbi:MAG: NADH-quinone oxidoreductase subunit C [Holophaga sp.]|nr:NADH-quinone oxidoreductase subunit C [Holophaga sp.]
MVIERIDEQLPGAILDRHAFRGDPTIVVGRERLLEVVDFIYREGFQQLMDVTAVDGGQRDPRFDVVYHLLNLASQERLRLKVRVADQESVPSLTGRFKSADWSEREVADLFGIPFDGHPDPRRLIMWEDYPGHPLRKDYPLDGGDAFCSQDIGVSYAPDARSLNG